MFIFPISGFGLLEAAAHPEVAQRTERIAHQQFDMHEVIPAPGRAAVHAQYERFRPARRNLFARRNLPRHPFGIFHRIDPKRRTALVFQRKPARVWAKALNGNDLKNNMCYVDPATDGLLAYWRFNEKADGKKVEDDLTGHGYKATYSSSAMKWVDNVRCPE